MGSEIFLQWTNYRIYCYTEHERMDVGYAFLVEDTSIHHHKLISGSNNNMMDVRVLMCLQWTQICQVYYDTRSHIASVYIREQLQAFGVRPADTGPMPDEIQMRSRLASDGILAGRNAPATRVQQAAATPINTFLLIYLRFIYSVSQASGNWDQVWYFLC